MVRFLFPSSFVIFFPDSYRDKWQQIKIWIYMCSCKISIHYQNIESLKCREWLRFLLIACRTILHVCISSMSLDLSFASKSAYRFQRLWTNVSLIFLQYNFPFIWIQIETFVTYIILISLYQNWLSIESDLNTYMCI